ncbi:arginine deiminase family protein [Planococcus sp. N028]|uniref:Arginine deiminase family protein n=1 Tax=Planococcus shixiaomingii TaxID=3058393 RepID=A0ABT8N357_9BACL|nr:MULTISPECIES: arginine deiminase family protein [unclassified Planococcus (in: firmicutes)]MDN7242322.1 arginine deiminase family protein [Planococcus sp. N028]WKA56799.1 arginine deiminase family protein [Planococcus sp. N022]
MFEPLERVIVKHPNEAFISQAHIGEEWQKLNYLSEPDFEEAQREYAEFLALLKQYVPTVDYLPESKDVSMDSIYAHDPVKFTPEGAILLKSGKKLRQPEAEVYRKFLADKDIPILGELSGDATADGGDIVWLDERVLAIGNGYRTNPEAISQIKNMTAHLVDEFIEVQLPHADGEEECLHLMSFISMVDKDLAVVYSPLMPVAFRKKLIEKGIRLIEVPKDEYDNLGCNVLALAPRICLMVAGNEETKKQLLAAGATVYEYKGEEISVKGTGGPTCLTSPVIRKAY